MSVQHNIKIKQVHLLRILSGQKTFDVRLNDRNYQVGDRVKFLPLDDENYNVYERAKADRRFNYTVTYVQYGYGLQDGYVVLGIEKEEG